MRPRFHRVFMAMTLSAVAFAFSWMVNWNSLPHGQLEVATAAAADSSGAPAPGDLSSPALVPPSPAPDSNAGAPAGAEVLSQGPVHEAFAKPMEFNPQPGPIVKKRPPDPIKEIPPEQQPEGDNIVWIPGYWGWDDDRNDFIWVSGVLRAAPPAQTWVPGYWSEVDGGFQWTPGLWTAAAKQEVSYLPQPPQSQENGPSSPQPSADQFWIPGTYVYQNNDYYWRPGYWTVSRPNWIWVPAHYCWTPGGYVFVDGYWDYELTRRGCLFAPVYFARPIYAQPAFVYTPGVVFNIGLFNDWLFVRPTFGAYYFGDYFGPSYASVGFSPWFSITIGGRPHYDPLFTYYRWHNSLADPNWMAHTQQHFDMLRKNEALGGPRTLGAARAGNVALVSSLKDVAKDPTRTDFKFHDVSLADRQALAMRGNELQQVAQQRVNIERKNNAQAFGGAGGGNSPRSGMGLNNAGATGAGGGNANSVTQSKLKLPTAAASNTALSSNMQGSNQTLTNNGAGPKFDSNAYLQNKTNDANSQTSPRSNRPSLIQPGNGLQSGGVYSGNGAGNQNNGGGSSANPSSPRMPLYPNTIAPSGNSGGSGSGAGRGNSGGSGSGSNKDKDDKKNKTSDHTSPLPHTNFEPAKPTLVDVPKAFKADRKATKITTSVTDDSTDSKTGASGLDLGNDDYQARDSASDDADRGNTGNSKDNTVKKSKAFSYEPPTLFHKHSDADIDPSLRWLLGNQNNSAAPDSDQSQGTDSGASGKGMQGNGALGSDRRPSENGSGEAGPSGTTTSAPPGGAGMAGTGPNSHPFKNPALIKYDYQTLFERGRSLSVRTSYAPTMSGMPSADSDAATPMPHGIKDPISSIGPGSADRTMYGPEGLTTGMPSGPLNSATDSGLPRGSGSYIPNSTLPQLPHFDLHMNRPNGPAAIPDPGARTYDPSRGY